MLHGLPAGGSLANGSQEGRLRLNNRLGSRQAGIICQLAAQSDVHCLTQELHKNQPVRNNVTSCIARPVRDARVGVSSKAVRADVLLEINVVSPLTSCVSELLGGESFLDASASMANHETPPAWR
jgi:hypothetical protein